VVNLALRALLAGELKQQVQQFWPLRSTPAPDLPSAALVLTSLRLEVRTTGITYCSSLCQKLMATCAPGEVARLRMALVQQLTERTADPSPTVPSPTVPSPTLSSEDLATALWSWIQVEAHPSGLLKFSLAAPGVLLWLQYWNQQPADQVTAALAEGVDLRQHG